MREKTGLFKTSGIICHFKAVSTITVIYVIELKSLSKDFPVHICIYTFLLIYSELHLVSSAPISSHSYYKAFAGVTVATSS